MDKILNAEYRSWRDNICKLLQARQIDSAIEVLESISTEPSKHNENGLVAISPSHSDLLIMAKQVLSDSFSELSNSDEYKESLRCFIAFLAWINAYPSRHIQEFTEITCEQFSCFDIDEYITHNYSFDEYDIDPKLELFIRTKMSRARSTLWLTKVYNESTMALTKGIKIFTTGDGCTLCEKSKKNYKWKDVLDMPAIPMHWGCRCMYLLWHT